MSLLLLLHRSLNVVADISTVTGAYNLTGTSISIVLRTVSVVDSVVMSSVLAKSASVVDSVIDSVDVTPTLISAVEV